jgi:hypothetical protein
MTGAAVAKPGASLSGEGRDRLLAILGQFERLVVSDDMGGAFFRMLMAQNPDVEIISAGRINETSYPLRFDEFILKAGIMGARAVVTVGGDGIASYTATAIIRQAARFASPMGILGFPAGTANVGPIVRQDNDGTSLQKSAKLDSIEVTCAGKVLGYGFNDVILGRTFLGTLGGRWANLNAAAMAKEGRAVESAMEEGAVTSEDFAVLLNGKKADARFGLPVKQICISTLHQDNLYGRAISGALVEASGFSHPAAVALLDKISNDARPETWGEKGFRTTAQMCFDAGDAVEIRGLDDGVCVIIDGNPFILQENRITVRCVPDSVKVFGIGG